jgi:hypothetical protein
MQSSNLTPRYVFKKDEISMRRESTALFIAAVFTTAKTWDQCKCCSVGKWVKKNVVQVHKEILFSSQ